MKKDGIKVKGHHGTWYVIDERNYAGEKIYLLEHEIHGDEALCVAINEAGEVLLEGITDGLKEVFDHLEEAEAKALDAIEERNRDMMLNPDSYFEPDDPRSHY